MSFSISYWDLIKFPYFADTTETGDRGVKERVTLWLTLMLGFLNSENFDTKVIKLIIKSQLSSKHYYSACD